MASSQRLGDDELPVYGCQPYNAPDMRKNAVEGSQLAERLEARITREQKELFKAAAAARGISLTDFVVNSLHEAAMRTLQTRQLVELGREDQRVFVQALLRPAGPIEALRKAVRRHGSRPRRRNRP